jgi:hypothetical protein
VLWRSHSHSRAIRQSDQYPAKRQAWAAGKTFRFEDYTRSVGVQQEHDLQLVIIRPLGYRLKKIKIYRQPAYLICTEPDLSIQKL